MTEFAKKKLEYFVKCGRPRPVDTEFIKGMTADVFDGCTMDEIKNYLYNAIRDFFPKNNIELKNMNNLILSYANVIANERQRNVSDLTRLDYLYSIQDQRKELCRIYNVEQKCIGAIGELVDKLRENEKTINDAPLYRNVRLSVTVLLASPPATFKDRFNKEFEKIFEGTDAFKTYEKIGETMTNYITAFDNGKLKIAEECRDKIHALEKELLEDMKKEILKQEQDKER